MKSIELIEEEARRHNDEIKKAILEGYSTVQKFYDNSIVFITGGSGFIGKQLIEKLIRSSNIRRIYILLRVKKEKTIHERIGAILDDPIFQDLHDNQGNFVDKLKIIEGDTSEEKLGIDEKNWTMLTDEVNVIFHAAASINFRESLKSATFTNVRGTRDMLRLAQACKHLTSVVHVSTAFSNATMSRIKGDVKEDFYKSPIPPEMLIQFADSMEEEKLNAVLKPIMEEWPNVYTFTKAVAEELVREMGEDLPICIVRPAIVISAYREPTLGWVDVRNVYGPSGLMVGLSLGVIHTIRAVNSNHMDFVPVDIVTNVILTSAHETHNRYTGGYKQTLIYAVSGIRNPFTWKSFTDTLENSRHVVPSQTLWYCFALSTESNFVYFVSSLILHYIPGVLIDGCGLLIGQRPRLVKAYNLLNNLSSVLTFFSKHEWRFHDENTLDMYNKLSDTDKFIYNCDMSAVDMKELIQIWTYGVRKFIIKDDIKCRRYAVKKQSILKVIHYTVFPLYICSLIKISLSASMFANSVIVSGYRRMLLKLKESIL